MNSTVTGPENDRYYSSSPLSKSGRAGSNQLNKGTYLPETELEYATSMFWGGPMDAVLDSPYVYCAYPNGLGILDFSDPLDPVMISTLYCPGSGEAICKAGGYVFLADGRAGLFIIDVTDPLNPLAVSSYTGLRFAHDIVVRDNLAFVISGDSRSIPGDLIVIIDVANPEWPVRLGTYALLDSGDAEDLCIINSIMLVAADHKGLEVVDISEPSNPTLLTTYPGCRAKSVAVRDTLAFVVSQGEYNHETGEYINRGLIVLNIVNPSSPDSIAEFEVPSREDWMKLELIDSLAIVTWKYDGSTYMFPEWSVGFTIINVSNPTTPIRLSRTRGRQSEWLPYPTAVILDTFALLFNPYPGIEVFSITNPVNPIWIQTVPSPGATRLIREDSLLYVVTPEFPGFHIMDITNPEEPLPMCDYRIDTTPFRQWLDIWNMCVADTLLYLAYLVHDSNLINPECICEVINVSDPFHPVVLARPRLAEMEQYWLPVQVVDTLLFLSNLIYNISDPTNPVEIGRLDTWGAIEKLIVDDTIVFACGSYLTAFNIADPTEPIDMTGHICPCTYLNDMYLWNNLLFIMREGYVNIYDVSDPTQITGIYWHAFIGRAIDVYENRAYVAGWYGLSIYDISDPTVPIVVDSFNTPGDARDVLVWDSTVFFADMSSLLVLKTTDLPTDLNDDVNDRILPSRFILSQNYPNPFNPSTTIEFNLSRASDVRLEIFNIMGQKVMTLIDDKMSAGEQSIRWNGKDAAGYEVATGIYFYRINAGDYVETKKMLLLK
jgi:hypothetical protein